MPGYMSMLGPVQKRSGTAWAALAGNGMVWFGSAAFLLGLAGEHIDAPLSGPWSRTVGFTAITIVGIGLAVGGVLDNHRMRPYQSLPAHPSD